MKLPDTLHLTHIRVSYTVHLDETELEALAEYARETGSVQGVCTAREAVRRALEQAGREYVAEAIAWLLDGVSYTLCEDAEPQNGTAAE